MISNFYLSIKEFKAAAKLEGFNEGFAEAERLELLKIAKNLLPLLDDKSIAQATELALDVVQELRANQ